MKPTGTKRLTVKFDILLSTSAFNFNLCRYIMGELTEKQETQREKILKKETKVQNMKIENERIQAKEKTQDGVGLSSYCSPRQMMPFNLGSEVSECVG